EPFPLPTPTRAGHVFLGWCEDSAADGLNGTGIFTLPQDPPGGGAEFWAAWAVNVGGPASFGEGWSYAGGVITIQDGANVVFTGSTTANRLLAASGVTATVKLKNVSVNLASGTAFSGASASVTLLLEGENSITVANTNGTRGISVTWLTVDSAASANAGTDSSSRSTEGTLYVNAGSSGGGAGISGSVTVLGGVVRAGSYYAFERALTAMGGVVFTQNSINTLTRPADSTAVVFVNTAPEGFSQDNHDDLVACGGEVTVSGGAVSMNSSLTVPSGVTLRIPAGVTFTIASNRTLTIASGGTLIVDGTAVIAGELQNGGSIINRGTITGSVTGGGSLAYPVEIRYHLNGGTLNGDTGESAEVLASNAQYTLPVPSFGSRAFLGWYGNDQFTGSPVTVIPSGSLGIREFWALWRSATPEADSASVAKTLDTPMTEVSFTLAEPLSGTWKVYAAASGDAPAPGVAASASGSTLTLFHGSDVPWGTYYVSLTEPGLAESLRAALTVVGEYSVTYHLDGVEGPENTTYQANSLPYALPLPFPAGKVFMGWYGNPDFTGSEIMEIPAGTLGPVVYWAWWEDMPTVDLGNPGSSGPRWYYSGGMVTVQNCANLILTGGPTANNISMAPGATAVLRLSGVIFGIPGYAPYKTVRTLDVSPAAKVTLLLEGTSTAGGSEDSDNIPGFKAAPVTVIDSAASANAGTDDSSRSTEGTFFARGDGFSGNTPGILGNVTVLGGVVIGKHDNYYGSICSFNYGISGTITAKGGVTIAPHGMSGLVRPEGSTAVVFVSNVPSGWDDTDHGDLVVCGSEVSINSGGAASGVITLNAGLTIPAGVTLRIPYGWTLKLNGHTLTIEPGGTVLCSELTGGSVAGDLTGHLDSGVITD
ncbi:MAG: InlB B-repeat-containing protein, partial [Spirochaetaceae bacterium]|nr:InlB B-repeat-containing protein [Spirochaetaceae bacterium]